MKIKIGPVEVEDNIDDEIFYKRFKEDEERTNKYLDMKSHYLDKAINNTLKGASVKTLWVYLEAICFAILYCFWVFKAISLTYDNIKQGQAILNSVIFLIAVIAIPLIAIRVIIWIIKKCSSAK